MGANRFPFLGYLAALAAVTGYSTRCAGLNMTEGVVGEYVLASINGAPLPFRIYNSEISHQNIVGGTLSLTDGGVVEFTTESQVGMFGATASRVDSVAGTYTHTSGVIQLHLPNSPAVTLKRVDGGLALDGRHLGLEFEYVFVWKRK